MTYEEFINIGGYDVIKKEYLRSAFINVGSSKKFSLKALNDSSSLQQYIKFYGYSNYSRCIKDINNRVSKEKRILNIIKRVISSSEHVYFATFTLNNDFVSEDYKLIVRKLTRILRIYCTDFICNADFGKSNNRLHFHGVISTDLVDVLKESYYLGFSDFQFLKFDSSDVALTKYLYKLRNHAIKDTTSYRIITKRKARC